MVLPSRTIVSSTVLPGAIARHLLGEIARIVTSSSPTLMIVSPVLMPAASAGDFVGHIGDERTLLARRPRLSAMSSVTGWICTPSQPRVTAPLSLRLATTSCAVEAGNGEADADAAARRRVDRGVDADDIAFEIEGGTAGIAAVDRGVDLQEVVIGAGADVAAARRDDAGRHRAAEAEGIADRHDPVADARLLAPRIST